MKHEIERPSRETTYMDIAMVVSQRATCRRAKVGCVITQDDRIVSTGYNGPASGWHCEQKFCGDMSGTCTHAIHAEANAIVFAAKMGISLLGSKMYCLSSPCVSCAKLIIQAGIKTLYFRDRYRDPAGMSILRISRVKVIQHPYQPEPIAPDENE